MSYSESLANRVRAALDGEKGITEKAMFGGLAFLHEGRMFCGLIGDELMVRVGPEAHEAALAQPQVRPMDFTGRPMKGYVYVGAPGCAKPADTRRWAKAGLNFVLTLPAKKPKTAKPKSKTVPRKKR